ncbi:hypothetical protein P280DRAFT_525000 [Massarina eburnea CBS 473.64]|uniref:RanBP2-type domain-containing protein n=1 Tax=Massarina eburnea CBS 473.64 TaxID=1395130 RepID=A0A6A6SJ74_9PLEO|nr:hypothetical protein P280DRAFT_525000 [Massarina eburnea CBS 473.64]
MNQLSSVPKDMWVCCECKEGNLVALANERCPVCSHARCGTCINPDQKYYWATSITSLDEHDLCSTHPTHHHYPTYDFTPPRYNIPASNYTSTASNDTWYCSECGALNLDHYDRCPVCGQGTKSIMAFDQENSYTTLGGAGSPAAGSWVCGNCGAANSSLTPDHCPACGAYR